mmetsp:Transcript_140335/g.448512  ORF Transcript_140335/g.448512 Transcript_140335/m.448512 type:complete len:225 (-) Transcript_140335:330-1004(-)
MASSSARAACSSCNSDFLSSSVWAKAGAIFSKRTDFLQLFAHAVLPLNVLLFTVQSEETLLVVETLPLQKLHLPEADQPTVLLLHLQHFSVVPKGDHSSSAMASSSARAACSSCISDFLSSSVWTKAGASSSKRTDVLQLFAHAVLPLNVLLFTVQSEETLLVFETLPLQKLHLPEADQPTVLLLHLQHFSVVPKGDHSCSCPPIAAICPRSWIALSAHCSSPA